ERTFQLDPEEDKELSELFDKGFFLKNPDADSDEPIVCYYWEPEQYAAYKKKHPNAKVWTVIEEDGKLFVVERWQYVNRQYYLIQNPKAGGLVVILRIESYLGDDTHIEIGGKHIKEHVGGLPDQILNSAGVMYSYVHIGEGESSGRVSSDFGYSTVAEARETAETVHVGAMIVVCE
ncbi:MAG: hypothetical protein ACE5KU_01680, partial [Nitrososphaerales archaeon]